MAIKNNIFEDLARVSSSVASVAFESVKNIQDSAKSKVASAAKSADLITRDEFEAFKTIATKAKSDSETLLKEFSDVKKQFHAIASNMDVIKELLAKNNSGSIEDNNKRIYADLKVFYEGMEGRLKEFSDMINQQSSRIDIINEDFEKVRSAPPVVKVVEKIVEKIVEVEKPVVEKAEKIDKAQVLEKVDNIEKADMPVKFDKVEKPEKPKVEKPKAKKEAEPVSNNTLFDIPGDEQN